MPLKDLTGKVVVVVGASSGYGLAAATLLLQQGATVIMASRHQTSGETSASDGVAGISQTVAIDVRSPKDVQSLAERTLTDFGRIDAWINTASIGAVGHFTEVDIEAHVSVIETDLLGTLYGSAAAVAVFRQQQAGVLVNVAADPEGLELPYMVSYAAAKYGVVGLSEALRAELRDQHLDSIHVCTVMPGDAATIEADEVPVEGEISESPKVQAAVLDGTADAIVALITSPKDKTTIKGTHYFL